MLGLVLKGIHTCKNKSHHYLTMSARTLIGGKPSNPC